MRILVTGGAGFIGSHVVDALIQAGHAVAVADDLSTGKRENLNPRATFHQLDIRIFEALTRLWEKEHPHYVVHCAAQVSVNHSVAEPLQDAQINILGSINLLECCRCFGLQKFVYVSTGGALYGEPRYLPCDEAHPIDPLSPYGASKHAVEHYLYLYRQNFGLNYTVLRCANVYGPRQDPFGEAGVVAIFTQRMLHGEQVVIFGSGEQQRDFVYVADVARACLLALEQGDGALVNIGMGAGTSVNQIYRRLKSLTTYPLDARYDPPRPSEPFQVWLEAQKAKEVLGWEPEVSLDEGLKRTVEWFRGQK